METIICGYLCTARTKFNHVPSVKQNNINNTFYVLIFLIVFIDLRLFQCIRIRVFFKLLTLGTFKISIKIDDNNYNISIEIIINSEFQSRLIIKCLYTLILTFERVYLLIILFYHSIFWIFDRILHVLFSFILNMNNTYQYKVWQNAIIVN